MKKNKMYFQTERKIQNKKTRKKTAQETIPFEELFESGLFHVETVQGKERYSMCFALSNANYIMLRDSEKQTKLDIYQEIFDGLNPDVHYQELFLNKDVNVSSIEGVMIPPQMYVDCGRYTTDYKSIQAQYIEEMSQSLSDVQIYFALSYVKQSKLDNPFNILMQSYDRLNDSFSKLGATVTILKVSDILKLFHTIYHPYEENEFMLPPDLYSKGLSIRDYIAPSSFYFKPRYTALGSKFNRILYVKAFSNTLDDSFLYDVLATKFRTIISKHITHIDKSDAIKTINNQLKSYEADRQTRNQRNRREGTDYIPVDLTQKINAALHVLDDLQEENDLFDVSIYIGISANSLEDLEDITKIIKGICQRHFVTIDIATFRQEAAMASILPLALDKLNMTCYLMSKGVSILYPFSYRRVFDKTGIFYGINTLTKAPNIIDRTKGANANAFYIGGSGSGKSITAKMEINDVLHLKNKDRVYVIDPESEFVEQCNIYKQAGIGETITVRAGTNDYINPFEIIAPKTEMESAIRNKSDLIFTIFEIFKGQPLSAGERTILDRCTINTYQPFIQSEYNSDKIPTFLDFNEVLKQQDGKIAKDLQMYLEMYVFGTADIFAHRTNVDLSKRYIVFDLRGLGKNLKRAGMIIILDFINQLTYKNFQEGVQTWLYTDEFQMYFENARGEADELCADIFQQIFADYRKRGGVATGITHNITAISKNPRALSMLQLCEMVVLFRQNGENLHKVAEVYNLSEDQKNRLDGVQIGEGMMIWNKLVIPFRHICPKGNLVYDAITTNFHDRKEKLALSD